MTTGSIPEGYHTLSPHIIVKQASEAIEFYKAVFDAIEVERRVSPDSKLIIYAVLRVGDSRLMISEEPPGKSAGGLPVEVSMPVTIHVWTTDVDEVFRRAEARGAVITFKPAEQFWGDYHGLFIDPYGHRWSVATRVRTLTPEEIDQAAEKVFRKLTK